MCALCILYTDTTLTPAVLGTQREGEVVGGRGKDREEDAGDAGEEGMCMCDFVGICDPASDFMWRIGSRCSLEMISRIDPSDCFPDVRPQESDRSYMLFCITILCLSSRSSQRIQRSVQRRCRVVISETSGSRMRSCILHAERSCICVQVGYSHTCWGCTRPGEPTGCEQPRPAGLDGAGLKE